jgi:hypothetical protein
MIITASRTSEPSCTGEHLLLMALHLVCSPLAIMHEDNTVTPNTKDFQKVCLSFPFLLIPPLQLLQVLKPDFVLMTLWFWNIPSAVDIFFELTRLELFSFLSDIYLCTVRSTLSSSKIGVLSDDAHTFRELVRPLSPPFSPMT